MAAEFADEIKKLILSVVSSTPESLTILRLIKDYYSLVGDQIPFRKLGYESLELYLHSIHDTVLIHGRGPSATVKARFSEKSAHVDKLIANQKKKARGSPRHGGNYRSYQNSRYNMQYGEQPISGRFYMPTSPSPQFHPPPLMSQYYPQPNNYINGYNSAFKPHYRSSSATSGYISNRSHIEEKRLHVAPTTSVQSKGPPIKMVRSPTPPSDDGKIQTHNTTMENVQVECAASAAVTYKSVSAVKAAMERISITPTRQVNLIPAGLESNSDDTQEESYDEGDEIFTDSDGDIPHIATPAPILAPEHLLQSQDWSPGCSTQVGWDLLGQTNYVYNIRVPRDVQDNLIELISSDEAKEGIWCGRLCDIYKERFGGNLSADRYCFPSLLAMCMELPGIFYCLQIQRGDYKVFDCRKPYPKDSVKMNTFVRKLESMNSVSLTQGPSDTPPLPEDHMSIDYFAINDQIPRLNLSSILSENDVIDVRVAEVYDPSKFWLYIVGPEFSDKLDQMMDAIQTFYKEKSKILSIPKEKMKVGLLCCAIYYKEYHRAVIIDTDLPKPHLVKVFFLDYGTVGKVQITNVSYLHRQYGPLPQQSIRARLSGIYPREAKTPWSRAAGRRFFDLVYDRQLIAHVDRINSKRQEMDIFLSDTSTDDDIHIPDQLVKEGHAIFTHCEQAPVTLDWRFEPIVQYIHLYPTFQEIETGRVHTITEMDQMMDLHVPYYIAYNHYFCQKGETKTFANFDNIPSDVLREIYDAVLDTNLAAPIDETANWVKNLDNSNISDVISIAEIEAEPFRRVIITECDDEKFLLVRFNNKVHLVVQQVLNYFKKKDLSIIQIRKLCVHLGIRIPCLTQCFDKDLFKLLLGMEQLDSNDDAVHLLSVEDVPIFYEKITSEIFSLDIWPNMEKILNFSSDIWVK